MAAKRASAAFRDFFRGSSSTLRRRLLVFLLLLVFTIMFGAAALLVATGVVPVHSKETEKLFSTELTRLTEGIDRQYGTASVQAARLSETLSAGVDNQLSALGYRPEDLKSHPELLNPIITSQLQSLLAALDNTDCSGVFLALDATVNPGLPDAGQSKAGLYIRNIELNVNGAGAGARLLLRGSPSLLEKKDFIMQAKWDLEFDVSGRSFWEEPAAAFAENRSLPLSRLVYWGYQGIVPNLDEQVMICSVPLISHDGNFFGVCGFEISAMNFMLRYNPVAETYPQSGFMLSASGRNILDTQEALYAGNSAIDHAASSSGGFRPDGNANGLTVFESTASTYVGLNKDVELLPYDTPFHETAFSATLFMPKEDIDRIEAQQIWIYVLVFSLLLALGIAASLILSKRYVTPITSRLSSVGESGEKTNIAEIDLLIEQLRAQGTATPDVLFKDFIARVHMLTPTELVVFQCHAEGLSYEETLKKMVIAPGTLKNHNRHIFAKLNVSSQDELRLYISLLKKCGLMGKIWDGAGQKTSN